MLIFLLGLLLFLVGIEGCKEGMNQAVSGKFKNLLLNMPDSLLPSIFIGIIFTAIIQSSSAVTVILISLLETKLVKFKTAIGIVLGANIGTTVTVQIITLPITKIYLYIILLGVVMFILSIPGNNKNIKYTGIVILSFGLVFMGLELMTGYFFKNTHTIRFLLLKTADNIGYGLLGGAFITSIIQSSSAVTGIIVSLGKTGLISLPAAVAIALGSNVGTCVTAFIASINCGRISRSLAKGHLIFNILGVLAVMPFFNYLIKIIELSSTDLVRQIANGHTIFNIFNVIIFLPIFNTFVSVLGGEDNGFN